MDAVYVACDNSPNANGVILGWFFPTTTGTLTIDALTQLSNGTFIAKYSFNLGNGAGGTMVGSGVATWK